MAFDLDMPRVRSDRVRKGIYEVRARHTAAAVSATFDEPNLVSCAGLMPVLRLAERAGSTGTRT